jgi:CP family cyanate transporter-like MFS transporter
VKLLWLLALLWLSGVAIRVPILAVPPVLPLIHDDLGLSETQTGLLIGLPSAMFAIAAVPGSLLVARIGVNATMIFGLLLTLLASAGRGAADNVWLLYAATLVMGFGIAVTQPALPRMVRDWMPDRVGFGVATYTNGMVLGATGAAVLTGPLVLPLVAQSWRLDLAIWSLPVALACVLMLLAPRSRPDPTQVARWWPDWKSPLIWLLGLGFGCNNAIYFGCNAVLPDYLAGRGESDLITPALGWLNGAQLLASSILLVTGERLYHRAWPFLVFGALTLAAFAVLVFANGAWIVACAGVIGFAIAVSFVVIMALPAALSPPQDVQRVAAGTLTIGYACAALPPTASGALWDLTGRPWTAFVPPILCVLMLTATGVRLSRYRPWAAAGAR